MASLHNRLALRVFISFVFVWLSTTSVAAQGYYIKIKHLADLYQFFRWKPNQSPLISAHRGGATKDYPENCIPTFEYTLSITPSLIECDIMMSKDSVAVMMHDKTLERTSNGKGKVIEHLWASLDTLKLKDTQGRLTNYEIPTLEEVLIWAKHKTILKLDVKQNFPADKLISLIRKHKAAAYVVIITYSLEDALKYHQLAPDLMLSITAKSPEDLEAFVVSGIKPHKLINFVGVDSFDPDVIAYAHQQNIPCILGTMHHTDALAQKLDHKVYLPLLKEKQIDIFATDQPLMLRKAIQEFFGNKGYKRKRFILMNKKNKDSY